MRYLVVFITAAAAMWMYIDRVCISIVADPIQTDLGLTDREKAKALGAFFLTYALFQIPTGALADRFGPRLVLTLAIAGWSLVTGAAGLVGSFLGLMAARLALGIAEAGAYPAAACLIKRWARRDERGMFSGIVSFGGRFGMAIAPLLTGWLSQVVLVGIGLAVWMGNPSGVNWRAVFVAYGLVGMSMAVAFWAIVRNSPHEWNAPEQLLDRSQDGNDAAFPQIPIEEETRTTAESKMPTASPVKDRGFLRRLSVLASNRGMWLFGTVQFFSNVSWAFLVTLLPTYLKDAGIAHEEIKVYQTVILGVGCAGMLLGGVLTDMVHRYYGARWGRSLPIAAMMGSAAIMCLVVSLSPWLWLAIASLCLMAMFQDLGIPSVWAYAQDVGGAQVGTALGWGNMWGNLGAALSPIIVTEMQLLGGWPAAFGLCVASYLAAAACGLLLDASKPIDATDA